MTHDDPEVYVDRSGEPPPAIPKQQASRARPPGEVADLGPVHRDLLIYVGKGMTNREIAGLLNVPLSTIAERVKVLFRRLGVSGRVEAAVLAAKAGLL